MARIAYGIGTFLLIPGVVLVGAGLLAAAIGYFGFDAALANHQDPTLFSSGNDKETQARAQMGMVIAISGLIGAGIGIVLAAVGGAIRAFAEDKPRVVVVDNRST
ncbi:MAG: hypothetical protein V4510_07135 [bacterium]